MISRYHSVGKRLGEKCRKNRGGGEGRGPLWYPGSVSVSSHPPHPSLSSILDDKGIANHHNSLSHHILRTHARTHEHTHKIQMDQ